MMAEEETMQKSEWNGYTKLDFVFEEHKACLVFPKDEVKTNRWALKTEYFEAFNDTAFMLLERGYHFAYIQNDNRWGQREDLERKKRFADYLHTQFGLARKCVPIGFSCGGLFAIKFAALYPETVSVLYLDAPVVELLSMLGLGRGGEEGSVHLRVFRGEILGVFGATIADMLSYRDHPLDHLQTLIKQKIPTALVYGGVDTVVYHEENCDLLIRAFEKTDVPFLCICKPECDHHPHGLSDPTPVVEFILAHDKD